MISIGSSYKIKQVVITFDKTVSSLDLTLGTAPAESITPTASGTITTEEDLDINTFSIKNTGTSQIHIKTIEITYVTTP